MLPFGGGLLSAAAASVTNGNSEFEFLQVKLAVGDVVFVVVVVAVVVVGGGGGELMLFLLKLFESPSANLPVPLTATGAAVSA
jgi:hypothetical protein